MLGAAPGRAARLVWGPACERGEACSLAEGCACDPRGVPGPEREPWARAGTEAGAVPGGRAMGEAGAGPFSWKGGCSNLRLQR